MELLEGGKLDLALAWDNGGRAARGGRGPAADALDRSCR
jgi:hypothetical protein